MVVASSYSAELHWRAHSDFLEKEMLRSFIFSIAPLVEDYHLFFTDRSVDVNALVPDPPANVYISHVSGLFQNGCPDIDIWHDFVCSMDCNSEQIRRFTGQNFHRTGDFRIEGLGRYIDTGRPDWNSYDGIIFPSQAERELLFRYDPDVTNSAAFQIISPHMGWGLIAPVTKEDARRLLGFPSDEVLYLCVSDFSVRMGTDLLPIITAFEMAAQDRPNLRLVIAGRDAVGLSAMLRDACNKTYSRQVSVLANPHKQVISLLFAAADVFVHLPDSPYKVSTDMLLYAMGHKLAIIAAHWPSCESLIDHCKSGILLPLFSHPLIFEHLGETLRHESTEIGTLIVSQSTAFDVQTLAEHMQALAQNRYREEFGTAAFDKFRLCHQTNDMARTYITFWNKLKTTPIQSVKNSDFTKLRICNNKGRHLSYPVSQINEQNTLRLTNLGEKIMGGKSVPIYDETSELIFYPIILEVLKWFRNPSTVNDALDALVPVNADRGQRALRAGILCHIFFALKRGLLSFNNPTQK